MDFRKEIHFFCSISTAIVQFLTKIECFLTCPFNLLNTGVQSLMTGIQLHHQLLFNLLCFNSLRIQPILEKSLYFSFFDCNFAAEISNRSFCCILFP